MNGELTSKLEKIKDDARQLGQHISEVVSEDGGKVVKEKFTDAIDVVQEKSKKVDKLARENTWVTAGIAVLVGMVIGLFVSNRPRS